MKKSTEIPVDVIEFLEIINRENILFGALSFSFRTNLFRFGLTSVSIQLYSLRYGFIYHLNLSHR